MTTRRVSQAPELPDRPLSLDDLTCALAELRAWAGTPSYTSLAREVGQLRASRGSGSGRTGASGMPGRVTVYDCFRSGRTRLDIDLVVDLVAVLGAGEQEDRWRQEHAAIERRASGSSVVSTQSPIPLGTPHFVGRATELSWVQHNPSKTLVITGMPGVGKTELALHLAWQRTWSQSYLINLRGYDAQLPPVNTRAILEQLHRMAVRAPTARGRMSDQSLEQAINEAFHNVPTLVILDNSRDTTQLSALIHALSNAQIIATSRQRVSSNREVAALRLDLLSTPEAVELLSSATAAVDNDEGLQAVRRLAAMCGRLPLSLALTAASLSERPQWSLRDHVARLESLGPGNELRAVMASSIGALPTDVATVFRAIAVTPTTGIDSAAVAAMCDISLIQAEQALSVLDAEHLLNCDAQGAYAMHDALKVYGVLLAKETDPLSSQTQALGRLVDHYSATVTHSCETMGLSAFVPPLRKPDDPAAEHPDSQDLAQDTAQARTWLEVTAPVAVELALHLSANPEFMRDHEVRQAKLAASLAPWLVAEGRQTEAGALHSVAAHCADPELAAIARLNWGMTLDILGQRPEAITQFELAERVDSTRVQSAAMSQRGAVICQSGRAPEGLALMRMAVEMDRHNHDVPQLAQHLRLLGSLLNYFGEGEEGVRLLHEALEHAEAIGDQLSQGLIHSDLCDHLCQTGQTRAAESHLLRVMELNEAIGNRRLHPRHLGTMAEIASGLGDWPKAESTFLEALEAAATGADDMLIGELHATFGREYLAHGELLLAREQLTHALGTGHPWIESDALNGLGELSLSEADVEGAWTHFQAAQQVAEDLGEPYEIARALEGLGRAHLARGESVQARMLLTSALQIFDDLASPRAKVVGELLDLVVGV